MTKANTNGTNDVHTADGTSSVTGYTREEFMFDRENIKEKLNKMYYLIDLKEWDYIKNDCFSPNPIPVDFTTVFGGESVVVSAEDIANTWKPRVENLDCSQHCLINLHTTLDPPGSPNVPMTAKAASSGIVHMQKSNFGVSGGSNFHIACRYEWDLERGEPDCDGNPWRISKISCYRVWAEGNEFLMHVNVMCDDSTKKPLMIPH
ncbi:hypothetical protein H072_7229 [Dactylellina haptotyla CBS 200.50]|uniref:SnoaL-like domain-containing protein n=1 Tax=Dactylellina haptotyla (strain CBS 200.50) TaxID=1284197 RepID=S8BI82_DACHA|nr:hypothetical protein H072_7229 [Dactylellina haptotyla CBS 200.50]